MSSTIEDRVILLLKDEMGGDSQSSIDQRNVLERLFKTDTRSTYGFWKRLAEFTKVSADKWRKVYERKQRPTSDVLSALAELWPEYAFWVMTGVTDVANGHTAPITATNFPEKTHVHDSNSTRYFKKSMELNKQLFSLAKIDVENDNERMYAIERTRPLAHWIGGSITKTAYELCTSEEYQELKKIQSERESNRHGHLEYLNGKNRPWEKKPSDNLRQTPILGVDPLTKHQDEWDLYYVEKNGNKEN